jgi:Cu/Ag efflux protein CusF
MKRVFLLLTLVAMALPAASALPTMAQTERVAEARHVEGRIQSVDPTANMLTLSDGTTLLIPDNMIVDPQTLKPGVMVRAAYEEDGGQKVVTSLEVQAD